MDTAFSTRLDKIEAVLHTFLPAGADAPWRVQSFGQLDGAVTGAHIAQLTEPCRALMQLGGKRWRPLLLVLCAELAAEATGTGSKAAECAYALTPLVEFAHTASLIHDDIKDGADTRRGKPAAHITYGMDTAINAASWLYFEAAACIARAGLGGAERAAFYELFLEELRRLHLGQAMDILWHRTPELVPTRAEYTAMVRNKTGTLARLAVKTGIRAGGGSAEDADSCGRAAEDIGTGFQILDDVTNLTTGNPGKKRGDDIVEGKKSLPVILHLEQNPGDRGALAALFSRARKDGIDSPAVEEAIALLSSGGAVDMAAAHGRAVIAENVHALVSHFGTGRGEAAALLTRLFGALSGGAPGGNGK